MTRRPIVVDLFAGTGAATAAFLDRDWHVVTIDLDRLRRPAVVADVGALPLRGPVDVVWASPPCTEFSDANPNRPARPSLELVFATLTAVRDLAPRYWILENVRGAIPYLGIPVQKVGPWCLWGYFPPLDVTYEAQTYRKAAAGRSAVARAAIPPAVAAAVVRSVERHSGLTSLLDLRPFRRHRHVAAPSGRRAPTPSLFES